MVFDETTGNAIDSFPYTAAELRRRADALEGVGSFTVEPSRFLYGCSCFEAGRNPGCPYHGQSAGGATG